MKFHIGSMAFFKDLNPNCSTIIPEKVGPKKFPMYKEDDHIPLILDDYDNEMV